MLLSPHCPFLFHLFLIVLGGGCNRAPLFYSMLRSSALFAFLCPLCVTFWAVAAVPSSPSGSAPTPQGLFIPLGFASGFDFHSKRKYSTSGLDAAPPTSLFSASRGVLFIAFCCFAFLKSLVANELGFLVAFLPPTPAVRFFSFFLFPAALQNFDGIVVFV